MAQALRNFCVVVLWGYRGKSWPRVVCARHICCLMEDAQIGLVVVRMNPHLTAGHI